jgi:hypothetical protein
MLREAYQRFYKKMECDTHPRKTKEGIVMPVFEKELEKLVERARVEGVEKYTVLPEVYDAAQGVVHGTLQTLACASLNPLDKKNAELATASPSDKKQKAKLAKNAAKAARGLKVSLPASQALTPTLEGAMQPWKIPYQAVKGMFPQHPWAGTLYGIRTNLPRNVATFTALPFLRDELEEQGYTPMQSKVIAGLGTGLLESIFTARARVIRTLVHTAKTNLSHQQVWEATPANKRSASVKSAMKWGAGSGMVYWSAFPALTQLFESQFKVAINYFQLGNSYTVKTFDYLLAGALAGAITPIFSYPLHIAGQRAMLKPQQNQVQRTFNYYCYHGLKNTIVNNTHVGFVGTALPRMMLSSAFFNLTLHIAKSACDQVFDKEEIHHKAPEQKSVPAPVAPKPAQAESSSAAVPQVLCLGTPGVSMSTTARLHRDLYPSGYVPNPVTAMAMQRYAAVVSSQPNFTAAVQQDPRGMSRLLGLDMSALFKPAAGTVSAPKPDAEPVPLHAPTPVKK